jgi:hypothetical protein
LPNVIKTQKDCQNIFAGKLLSLRFVVVWVFIARLMGYSGSCRKNTGVLG